jgi:hypothetical protein
MDEIVVTPLPYTLHLYARENEAVFFSSGVKILRSG